MTRILSVCFVPGTDLSGNRRCALTVTHCTYRTVQIIINRQDLTRSGSGPQAQFTRTLVLDLDDVLIKSDWNRERGWRVFKRPGVEAFLKHMAQFYEASPTPLCIYISIAHDAHDAHECLIRTFQTIILGALVPIPGA